MSTVALLRDIGRSVGEARKSAGLTQKQLAALAGVSERLVRSVENGEAQNVSISRLISIMEQLGLDLCVVGSSVVEPVTQDASYSDLLQQAVASWKSEEY